MSDGGGEYHEGRPAIGRVETFSDAVIAIILTIMVLEFQAPVADGMGQLWSLWPIFVAYALSYAYVAIYWVNHHRLFSHATVVSNDLIWSNMFLLFALSLVPFSTSYLGKHLFSRDATLLYLATVLFPAIAYTWLQHAIRRTGLQGPAAVAYHAATMHKGIFATVVYLAGVPLTFIAPWLGIACAGLVAFFWFLPRGPLDRLFVAPATRAKLD